MGLFSTKQAVPLVYAPVARTVHVPAAEPDVVAHLAGYSALWSPKRAVPHEVRIATVAGWTAIRLPDAVHPWQLHNLAFWMLDCPGASGGDVVAESAAGPDHPSYRLVRDPEVPDSLCGWDEAGSGWTVRVPDNTVVRGDVVPVARSFLVPSGYDGWHSVPVLLEDPGSGMNERNESNAGSRTALAAMDSFPSV